MFTPRRIIPPPSETKARDLTELLTAETEGGMKCVNPGPELPAAEVDKEKELPEEPDEGQVSPTQGCTKLFPDSDPYS